MGLQHSRAMESRGTGNQDNGEVISTPLCELQNRWALRFTTRGMEGHKRAQMELERQIFVNGLLRNSQKK